MEKTFTLRRQEVLFDAPMVSDVQERWPALFDVIEINAEFRRITTMPLQSRFLSQLDLHSANLLRVFVKRSGQQGKTLRDIVAMMTDMTEGNTLSAIERTVVGIYVARQTPGSDSSDVGLILKGVVVLRDLENVALATAMLFGFFLHLKYEILPELTTALLMEMEWSIWSSVVLQHWHGFTIWQLKHLKIIE
ncbi:hypothetical protein SRHO_G00074200 [Serrasalmus rhombeus]